jgi:hypothetical protein
VSAVPHRSGPTLRRATLVASHMRNNLPFTPGAGPNGGEFFLPWRALREHFLQRGIELNTRDRNAGHAVAFELHLNAQRRVPNDRPCYAYLYEDPIVRPLNAQRTQLARYRRVFTSNEELIDGRHILRLDYPNDLSLRPELADWHARDLFCVLIASNKALLHPHPRNLHALRVETIRFFEAHAPELFTLWGPGWDRPAVRPGRWGRIEKRLNEWKARLQPGARPFPSYRGVIKGPKREVLDRARFAICYENSQGSPGYLTEKIFDCFTSGCVPVYLGTTHAQAPIPVDCFIDRAQFPDLAALLAFMRAVTPERYAAYRQAQAEFLRSAAAQRFSNAYFCEFLSSHILADLAHTQRPDAV